jgi:cysteine synthase/cystathionine beta-lyase/cystathionine gamma-synthase
MNRMKQVFAERQSASNIVERKNIAYNTYDEGQKAKLLDLVEDLRELKFLINDLDNIPESNLNSNPRDNWSYPQYAHTIKILKARYRRSVNLIENATRWADSQSLDSLLQSERKEYHSIKSTMRVAYRQKGVLLCANDWQSPIYGCSDSSISLTNFLAEGIKEHSLDYKRDGHLDAEIYEKDFIKEYTNHLGSSKLSAYLTNCGMAAFTTVLHWVANEFGSSALAVQPMYFENIHLAKNFFPDLKQLNPACTEQLKEQLKQQNPSVVIVDSVTNCGEVTSHDFQTILQWARTESNHQIALIIDTTCLPSLLLPANLFDAIPENVSVFLIESLAKYHQFGMDLVTGGIIIAHLNKNNHSDFRKTRARLGTNITDSSAGSLPQPNAELLTKRLKRHSRNAGLLVKCIQDNIDGRAGVVNSISWLDKKIDGVPWFNGSCFTVRFDEYFRSTANYLEFENRIIELAKEAKLIVALSTSFGFDITRLAITAPSTLFEDPFLRVSIGTESINEIKLLSEIITRASLELSHSWKDKLQVLNSSKSTKRVSNLTNKFQQISVQNGHQKNIKNQKDKKAMNLFLGEEALKNYLCPDNYPSPPLVELPSDLNPLRAKGVRLFAKMMPLVPLMNIKSLPAFSMLEEAAARNELQNVQRIIESSSSNTVLSLSVMAKLFGIDNTCAIVDHSIAPALLNMLRLFGIEIFLHPAQGHEAFGHMEPRSKRAANLGNQAGWYNPGQYSNGDNPEAFAKWLAPDLWSQTEGHLDIISCPLGTCGTMVGLSRGLREFNPSIKIVANCPAPGNTVPGPREHSLLADVTFAWQDVANARFELSEKESFAASVSLFRRGIFAGPSSGMNYVGLINYIEQEIKLGSLDSLLDKNGEVWCTFLCCDSPLPHVDEYYKVLGEEFFPSIHAIPQINANQINAMQLPQGYVFTK